jgi:hypothetical protein
VVAGESAGELKTSLPVTNRDLYRVGLHISNMFIIITVIIIMVKGKLWLRALDTAKSPKSLAKRLNINPTRKKFLLGPESRGH